MSKHREKTAEQEARELLERMGVEGAQNFSSGEVVELANIVAKVRAFSWRDVDLLQYGPDESHQDEWLAAYADLADRIEALLPPRTEP